MPRRRTKDGDWRPKFLEAFREQYTVTLACKAAGIARQTAYDERYKNEAFAAAWLAIDEEITEQLEREAIRRAMEGWTERETMDADGNVTSRLVKYSDRMLEMLLRARNPAKYRENVFVEAGGGVEHTHTHTHEVTLIDGRDPVEVEASGRRAAARALLPPGEPLDGSSNGSGP